MTKAAPLPDIVARWLDDFVQSAKDAFKDDLLSVTLFGSAAEGRLRPSSDVNLILVLKRFDQTAADAVSEPFRAAHAAIILEAMFILETEVALAAEAFAVKFADIETRHEVLFGKDYFSDLEIPLDALKFRVTAGARQPDPSLAGKLRPQQRAGRAALADHRRCCGPSARRGRDALEAAGPLRAQPEGSAPDGRARSSGHGLGPGAARDHQGAGRRVALPRTRRGASTSRSSSSPI